MPRAIKPTRKLPATRAPDESQPRDAIVRAASTPARSERVSAEPLDDTGIERGAHVRVTAGPFSGKLGIVDELDGKGGARVLLGLLPVRLELKHLKVHADRRRRPVLATSHRKPVPVRS